MTMTMTIESSLLHFSFSLHQGHYFLLVYEFMCLKDSLGKGSLTFFISLRVHSWLKAFYALWVHPCIQFNFSTDSQISPIPNPNCFLQLWCDENKFIQTKKRWSLEIGLRSFLNQRRNSGQNPKLTI